MKSLIGGFVLLAFAVLASMPRLAVPNFAAGLPKCEIAVGDAKCSSVGENSCPKTKKKCNTGDTLNALTCEDGLGSTSEDCANHPDCAAEKHAKRDNDCNEEKKRPIDPY